MPTSFALTPHFDAFIQEQLASGRYNNASEVVRDALRLLERAQRAEEAKLEALRRAADQGFASLDAGDYLELDAGAVDAVLEALGEAVPTAGTAQPQRTGTAPRRR